MGSNKNRGLPNRQAHKANTFTHLTKDQELTNELKVVIAVAREEFRAINKQLAIDIKLVGDAIDCNEIDCRLPVRSVIETFTLNREINQLIECVDPQSRFYKNKEEVIALVDGLKYWGKEAAFSYKDSLRLVLRKLNERYNENDLVLQSYC
jgi:hypothetical protein